MGQEFTHKKFLNDMELGRLRKTLQRFEHKEPRNVLLIKLALATGARPSELLALTAEDFHLGQVAFKGLKGSKYRDVPVNKGLFVQFKRHGMLKPGERVFPISYPRLAQIWAEYTPNKYKSFRCLRHTFALNLFEKTKDIRLVQIALGHRSIENTLIYADYHYQVKELRRVMNQTTLVKY